MGTAAGATTTTATTTHSQATITTTAARAMSEAAATGTVGTAEAPTTTTTTITWPPPISDSTAPVFRPTPAATKRSSTVSHTGGTRDTILTLATAAAPTTTATQRHTSTQAATPRRVGARSPHPAEASLDIHRPGPWRQAPRNSRARRRGKRTA